MRGHQAKRSYDFSKKNLLSKLEIGRAEKKISAACKIFLGAFFFLIPEETFK